MKTILLVDDEPDFVEVTKMRLEANNFDVITARDGKEGLETARREKPDLILLDVMMPDMDGFRVLSKLRRSPETQEIPVIMLTAKGESKSIFKAKDMGSTDYLIKPCDSEELLRWVKKYV